MCELVTLDLGDDEVARVFKPITKHRNCKTDSTFDTQGTSALPDLLTINSYHVANLTYVINGISTTRPQEGSGKCEE